MHQAVIVSGMLVSGLALFGSVVWIQTDRSAWTSVPENEVVPVRATISSLRDEPARVVPEPSRVTIELEPVEIVGRKTAPPRAAPKPPELVAAPCSDWQEIGPERVIDGAALGMRRVRQLCSRPIQTDERTESEPAALAAAQY